MIPVLNRDPRIVDQLISVSDSQDENPISKNIGNTFLFYGENNKEYMDIYVEFSMFLDRENTQRNFLKKVSKINPDTREVNIDLPSLRN
jgi:hypothetical protein